MLEQSILGWLIVGLVAIAAGVGLMAYALKRRAGSPPQEP